MRGTVQVCGGRGVQHVFSSQFTCAHLDDCNAIFFDPHGVAPGRCEAPCDAVGSLVRTRFQRRLRCAQREDCNACFFETPEVAADSGPTHCGAVDHGSATPVQPQLRLLATQQRASLTSLTPRS
jgi:hypothetical protein